MRRDLFPLTYWLSAAALVLLSVTVFLGWREARSHDDPHPLDVRWSELVDERGRRYQEAGSASSGVVYSTAMVAITELTERLKELRDTSRKELRRHPYYLLVDDRTPVQLNSH